MRPEYSDLEAVRRPDYEGLQVINDNETSQKIPHEAGAKASAYPSQPAPDQRTICGLRSKTFWVLTGIIMLVVVAAVGGGVGGALSHTKNTASSSNNTAQGAATSALPSPTSSNGSMSASTTRSTSSTGSITSSPSRDYASLTTTEIPGATTTLLRDCPSSNNTIYDVTFGSEPRLFRKVCNMSYLNSIKTDVVNIKTANLDDCINRCASYNVQQNDEIKNGTAFGCNAVCWRNTFDTDWPGQCFGFQTQNSSSGFELRTGHQEIVCDSAAWINQSFD